MKQNVLNKAAIKNTKKQRGIALVFTLGILGLLTVIVLGFASTALLNRKISENTINTIYARSIAKNIAFPRARYAIEKGLDFSRIYSANSTDPDSASIDWLWTLDTKIDGAEIYSTNPASLTTPILNTNARWQYVRNTGGEIVGRYAYVVVQDTGRLDPSINIKDETNGTYRPGFSEKELALPTKWDALKAKYDSTNPFRWATFYEIFKALGTTAVDKKSIFNDGVSVGQLPSPEAYWIDNPADSNEKKDTTEFYLRCNLVPLDWLTVTVDDLIGTSQSETQLHGSASKSINFIPWLKNWTYSHNDWTPERMKKQIAANIIQYNLPKPNALPIQKTISDKDGDWANDPPAYAGVGRHPMLNEFGFGIRVKADVVPTLISAEPEIWEYEPSYYITINYGVELINIFFDPTSTDNNLSTIKLPNASIEAKLLAFKDQADFPSPITTLDDIISDVPILVKTNAGTNFEDMTPFPAFELTITAAQWNSSPSYSTAASFWKGWAGTKTVKLKKFRLEGGNQTADIKNWMELQHVNYKPGNAVLYFGPEPANFSYQRDIARLKTEEETSTRKVQDEHVYYISYETTDPQVNHYESDWPSPKKNVALWHSDPAEQNKLYPGTIFDSNGVDELHKNSTIPATIPGEATTDPAYYGASNKRISTAFVRHAQMQSLWELGCISRAEAWETLNLSKTRTFALDTPLNSRGGGPPSNGDANILDQVKFNDNQFSYGKVNINGVIHNTFSALFNDRVKWFNEITVTPPLPPPLTTQDTPFDTTGTDSTLVCTSPDTCITLCADISTCSSLHTCLAHFLMERSHILPFSNRSDLLVAPADIGNLPGYSNLSATAKLNLQTAQTNLYNCLTQNGVSGRSKMEKEQYAARFMNLLCANPIEKVYVIVIAQTIRDVGGTAAFVDWNKNTEYETTDLLSGSDPDLKNIALKNAGYIRNDSGKVPIPLPTSLMETITNTTIGTYDIGADKITSGTKLIVTMVKDPMSEKWRVQRYQYVE